MKYGLLLVLAIAIVTACSMNRDISQEPEVRCVTSFMNTMQAHPFTDSLLVLYISPEWLKENELEPKDAMVNAYDPEGFTVKEIDSDTGEVVVVIWGEDHKWQHRLFFKTTDDGQYILPSGLDGKKITPWMNVVDNE